MNRIEDGVQRFWKASLAWKRVPGYTEGTTIGELLEELSDLTIISAAPALQEQVEDLSMQIVHGRARRKKRKGKVIKLPQNSGSLDNTNAAQKVA